MSLKQGNSVSPVLHGILHMYVSHEDFCCKCSQDQAESRLLNHKDDHKILLQNAPDLWTDISL